VTSPPNEGGPAPATRSAAVSQAAGRRMRVHGLVRKEALQILRDPSSISIAFVLPVILLLLFGYGVSLDAKHVPIALVVENPTQETSGFSLALAGSRYLDPRIMPDRPAAEAALLSGDVDAIVVFRADFARQIWLPQGAPIQVIVDGTDANTARIISGYMEGAWRKWLEQRALEEGRTFSSPVVAEQRVWFNPEVRSQNFLVPGLIAIIMTLIGTLLTALVVAREWERGTMEALLVRSFHYGHQQVPDPTR